MGIYPPVMLRRGVEGETVIRVLVSSTGVALKIEVYLTSGHEEFDASAIRAVENFRFSAAMKNGVPTMAWAQIPVAFRIAK